MFILNNITSSVKKAKPFLKKTARFLGSENTVNVVKLVAAAVTVFQIVNHIQDSRKKIGFQMHAVDLQPEEQHSLTQEEQEAAGSEVYD